MRRQLRQRAEFVDLRPRYVLYTDQRSYGCLGFLGDLFMIVITGGLWLLWIFVREMRRR